MNKEKIEAFLAEYKKLIEKHGFFFKAVVNSGEIDISIEQITEEYDIQDDIAYIKWLSSRKI